MVDRRTIHLYSSLSATTFLTHRLPYHIRNPTRPSTSKRLVPCRHRFFVFRCHSGSSTPSFDLVPSPAMATLTDKLDDDGVILRPDIPDDVLRRGWTKDVRSKYHIASKQFYEVRQARKIITILRPGPASTAQLLRSSRKAIDRAASQGHIAESTAKKILPCFVTGPKVIPRNPRMIARVCAYFSHLRQACLAVNGFQSCLQSSLWRMLFCASSAVLASIL